MKIMKIDKQSFISFYNYFSYDKKYDVNFLYDVYSNLTQYYNEELEKSTSYNLDFINPIRLFNYLYAEYDFIAKNKTEEQIKEINQNQKVIDAISSFALDKYLTNEKLDLQESKYANEYSPCISTLNLYLNFMNKVNLQYSKNNPFLSLISDILMKCIKISKCTLELLVEGFEAEAFSTWRTLHETECILYILVKYQRPVVDSYLKHLTYSLAYRKVIQDEERVNNIFVDIKSEMKHYNLKSKDMKKFIEYGYLLEIEGFKDDPTNKLNFRDGVEKYAGLSNYSKLYEYSSEIAHSSPLMIYSNEYPLFHLTLICVYEVFFRIEKVFSSHLLSISENKDFKQKYLQMRSVYYKVLTKIYNDEKTIYNNISDHKTF